MSSICQPLLLHFTGLAEITKKPLTQTARFNYMENEMTEQQLRQILRANGVEEDELEAQVDRFADDQRRDRIDRELENTEKPE